ncbi:MAG: PspC domain-containing protein [Clostridia bacterium]|nr:PspC domain-containing protein [Clostridia bacterium]
MKKLTKSLRQRKIAGVCGGIAEYLNVDVTVVRLVTIALMMAAGSGLLAYIVAAVVMPDPEEEKYEE